MPSSDLRWAIQWLGLFMQVYSSEFPSLDSMQPIMATSLPMKRTDEVSSGEAVKKGFNFITRLHSMDLFSVFLKLFWDLFHSYFPGHKVAYVLKFEKSEKINFTIAIFDQI